MIQAFPVIIIGRLQSRRLRASSSNNDPVPIQTLPKGVECIWETGLVAFLVFSYHVVEYTSCNPFTLWNRANSVSNFSMICRSKTCTVRKFRVNEMRLCASFCPFICPDVFNLNVVLSSFKLSPTLLGIASKIVAIQHTHRRFLFLSSHYNTLSSQNNSVLLSPIVLLFYYQSRGFQLHFQFQSSGLSGSHV